MGGLRLSLLAFVLGACNIPTSNRPGDDAPTPACGDGFVDPGEVCDDGNDQPGDGCFGCRPES